jgi:hypothetical protein
MALFVAEKRATTPCGAPLELQVRLESRALLARQCAVDALEAAPGRAGAPSASAHRHHGPAGGGGRMRPPVREKASYRSPRGKPLTPSERRKADDGWEVSQKTKGPVPLKGKKR